MLPLIAAGIGAAANLAGGWLKGKADEKANAAQYSLAQENMAMQKQFAERGITMKVNDAKNAGIHPLFALGANTHSFAPVSVGSQSSGGLGGGIAAAGQDISRGIMAASSAQQKMDVVTQATTQLSLERGALENQLLRSQIRRLDQQSNPSMPSPNTSWLIPGQGETSITGIPGTILDKPLVRSGTNPNAGEMESGAIPDVGYAKTKWGYAPVPAKDVKERIEDIMPAEWMWFMRNQIAPSFGGNMTPPVNLPLPEGADAWVFNPFTQTYQAMRRPKWMGPLGKYFHY